MRYRGPPDGALTEQALDVFTAVFHRPSGTTHLLAEPAPQILSALSGRALDLDELMAALGEAHELADPDRTLLIERLDELVAAGLVEGELVGAG